MSRLTSLLVAALVVWAAGCAASEEVAVVTERAPAPPDTVAETPTLPPDPVVKAPFDTVSAGRFDQGKMWTFDNPPLDYLEEAYGFRPDSAWFARARRGALRFSSYCSASFVSPHGLVLTNHHCGRESISQVSRKGEDLLDHGFYADSLGAEREVEDLHVDQLIRIDDVTERVYAASEGARGDDAKAQARQQRATRIEERMTAEARAQDSTLFVEVIALYNGGQYSAYTFRRYDDVRLVMAPELQLGFFGGEPDNFTYPRYALDFAVFRVYGDDGEPLATEHFFPWSQSGAQEGDPVFVVGNPGTTSRLTTISQLEFERDVALPLQLDALGRRAEVLEAYIEAHPDSAEQYDLRNTFFSMANTIKASRGQLGGLEDPLLLARRRAAEQQLLAQAPDTLRPEIREVLQSISEVQRSKEAIEPRMRAFSFFGSELGARIFVRGLYGYYYSVLKQRGLPEERLAEIREQALAFDDWPEEVEEAFVRIRLRELERTLGADDPTIRRVLQGRTPAGLAADLVDNSALVDSARYAALLEEGYLRSDDPSVPVIDALAPLYFQFAEQQQGLQSREENLNARLARARFEVYGTTIPPDASFSLRLADGVVQGYEFNGTRAPAFTTYFGLYNHYYAYGDDTPWDLPERWLEAPPSFDRSTPLNLVSTNDITGGNSGSPLLNEDLELVGLIFDSNIEALPNEYLYTDQEARAVSVDARGILEALDHIYDADRIVQEVTTGRVVPTEAEADATTR